MHHPIPISGGRHSVLTPAAPAVHRRPMILDAAVAGRAGAATEEAEALITLAVVQGQRGRAEEAATLFERAEQAVGSPGRVDGGARP